MLEYLKHRYLHRALLVLCVLLLAKFIVGPPQSGQLFGVIQSFHVEESPESKSQIKPITKADPSRVTEDHKTSEKLVAKKTFHKHTHRKRDLFKPDNVRLAIIMYIPAQIQYVYQFLGLIYGSWKYVTTHAAKLLNESQYNDALTPDLLVFCHPDICSELPEDCKPYPLDVYADGGRGRWTEGYPDIVAKAPPQCWYISEAHEVDFPYPVLNSFIMFNRSDIQEIGEPYKYILRTDIDCYMSPEMLLWRPTKHLVVGQGGYCDQFNMDRLKMIAKKLGMTHRGVHCAGSTWYGEVDIFIKLAKKTLEMTKYMFLNEFDPEAKGLETIDFKANREGEWIRWWRPVSLLYGGELALNDMIPDFDQSYKQNLDASSCSSESIWNFPHIHCWHSPCEFSKFTFMDMLSRIINTEGNVPSAVAHRILANSQFHDARPMTVQEFCTYIAWNSAGKYMSHLLAKNEKNGATNNQQ